MDEPSESAVLEFMARFLADREKGEARPLDDYLPLYPGHERQVGEEYAALIGASAEDTFETDPERLETLGPYRLVREIGRGGQGSVWLAEDTRFARQAAVKVVPRSPLLGDLSPRLRREAQVTASLDHPGICAVYDVGAERGVAWMAMRYVDGEVLTEWWSRQPPGAGRTTLLLELLEQVARALHVAHEAGVVHRDIKPSNIMVARDGSPVILDFGVARQDEDGMLLTLSGDAVGTPAYMSPEQLGAGEARVDRRTDVWSLGVTLYEALAGERPFVAPTRDRLMRTILESEPAKLSGSMRNVSRDLDVVIRTALEKDLDRRYQSALDLAEDLRRFREHEPVLARPASVLLKLRRWARRNPALAAALTALFLVLVVAVGVTSTALRRTRSTLTDKEALLDDVTRLSDQKVIRDLLGQMQLPRPLTPKTAPEIERWINRAREVLERAPLHQQAHDTAMVRILIDRHGQPVSGRDAETDVWFAEQLGQLLEDVVLIDEAIAVMEPRLAFARNVQRLTIEEHADAWDKAIAEIFADPRFEGLVIRPQIGLIPLGPDPETGLQEFAHLQSGSIARRDPSTHRLVLEEDTGIVLVLLPGGTAVVGAEPPGPERPEGSPNVDPHAGQWDGPVQTVPLDPFFLSKYEMTQGQWRRHDGANPSAYQPGRTQVELALPMRHPVEMITVAEAKRVLGQLGLALPTEVQWEYGSRAGTTTIWWTGNEPENVAGAANLADVHAKEHGGHEGWRYDLWLDDGHTSHAPVGSFLPNPFGLHDTIGNVSEWTDSTWEDWRKFAPRAGDGACPGEEDSLVHRGGNFSRNAAFSRSGQREAYPPGTPTHSVGLRPARVLEE